MRLINLDKETIEMFGSSQDSLDKITYIKYKLGTIYKKEIIGRGCDSFNVFKNMILTYCPFEDEVELQRFWEGKFYKESTLEFIRKFNHWMFEFKINPNDFKN